MLIIKHGKPPKEREYTATCRNCQAVFIAQESEGIMHRDREKDSVEFKCPCCKYKVFVTVPKKVLGLDIGWFQ